MWWLWVKIGIVVGIGFVGVMDRLERRKLKRKLMEDLEILERRIKGL